MKIQTLIYASLAVVIILSGLLLTNTESASATTTTAAVSNCTKWHTVQKGEYLSKIASMYGVKWQTLAEINKLKDPRLIYPGQKLCITTSGNVTPTQAPVATCDNRISAIRVQEDAYVTLQGRKLLADTRYYIYLKNHRADASRLIYAGSMMTDKNGNLSVQYRIPHKLIDVARIDVYITNRGKDSASNWFYNATAEGSLTGGTCAPSFSFSILELKKGVSITIKTVNLPPNIPFNVLIGKAGTRGENGTLVGALKDGDGVIKGTFTIPADLAGNKNLDIRMENKTFGLYYFQTFENMAKK